MMERTGSPKELAHKLGVSERTVYHNVSYMKREINDRIMLDNQMGNVFIDEYMN